MMQKKDEEQFESIAFAKDREAVLRDLIRSISEISVIPDRGGELRVRPEAFEINEISSKILKNDITLQKGDRVKLCFSLESGQYFFTAIVVRMDGEKLVLIPLEAEFFRLQRRNNFRIRLQVKNGIKFKMLAANGQHVRPEVLSVVDFSAGGVKISAPVGMFEQWQQRTFLEGELDALEGRVFQLKARVANVSVQGGVALVGLEFMDVSSRDQEALLTACLALRRQFGSVYDR